ncbi:dipeptidase A [Breznakia blatticola]|uniref:Dipeptidase n=1 Tax=Breznakia blatticola TaxID=1754012 RepID=A0A4V3G6S4_9FIRM|nr:C69 family dipeptidase [Breznakia blatticola]TDW16084.1 dipeptidase A [Breznakia blatticola]
MKKRYEGDCTTILVGKKASIDGSTMIARNEDGHEAIGPKQFILVKPEDQPKHYKAILSKLELDLPDNPLPYTCMPDATRERGIWGEAGINSRNVAMSATETITTNARILAADPYVENGFGEEDIFTLVLPYIHSAKEGILRMAKLLETYGTYEPNGIAFSDADEIWWIETIGGHNWAAIRVPDDSYVVASNRFGIDQFDFNSPDCMYSKGLPKLIDDYKLNPLPNGPLNLRKIFGSYLTKDHHYNNPRVWYVQRYFNPKIEQDPQDGDIPFVRKADQLITPEDIKFLLSSHYEDTPFDPYDLASPNRRLFRPIGINRNHCAHILQIRNDVPSELAGLHWVGFGPNSFNSFVPFYSNISETPTRYKDTTGTCDMNNMYWLSCNLALLGDANYDLYKDSHTKYLLDATASYRKRIQDADKEAMNMDDVQAYLETVNREQSEDSYDRANALLQEMMEVGTTHMILRYTQGD